MTTTELITPPPEQVDQWLCADDYPWGSLEQTSITITTNRLQNVATRAAQWGADQELEACCMWMASKPTSERKIPELRAARRPKPPSLKELALIGLSRIESTGEFFSDGMKDLATIRRALEALDD